MECSGEIGRKAVERLVGGRLDDAGDVAAREHLTSCATCRAAYDRGVRLLQVARGDREPLAPEQVERIAGSLLGPPRRSLAARLPWIGAGIAAIGATAALALVPLGTPPEPAARGAGLRAAGLRLFCVAADDGGVRASGPDGALRCVQGDVLQAAATNRAPAPVSLVVTAEDASGELHRLWPASGEPAVELPAGAVDQLLPGGIRLEEPGSLRLRAAVGQDRTGLEPVGATEVLMELSVEISPAEHR